MPEKKTLNEDLFYKGSSANLPRLHTCENKTPFWDKSKSFASQWPQVSWCFINGNHQADNERYIYISLRKTKLGLLRIINLFPSCYGYWYESITPNLTRLLQIQWIWLIPPEWTQEGRVWGGWRGVKSFLIISPTSGFSFINGQDHNFS